MCIRDSFLTDVNRSLNLSIDEKQSAIAMQEMFNQDNTRMGGSFNNLALNNTISNMPQGGSSGLAIATGVVGGLSTGINVGSSIYNSGAFGTDDGPTFETDGVPYR